MKWSRSKSSSDNKIRPLSFPTSHLESWSQRCQRLRYLRVLLLKNGMFFLLNSVTLPQTWSYLQSAQPDSSKNWSAWVVSMTALLRVVTSPMAGWLTRQVSFRWVSLACDLFTCLGGLIWSLAYIAPIDAGSWLLLSRIVMGLCGGQLELLMTYIARCTSSEERSQATAYAATSLSVATLLGPALLTIMSFIGTEGLVLGSMRFNTFTVSSLTLTALMCLLTAVSCCTFSESNLAEDEVRHKDPTENKVRPAPCSGPFVCLLATAHSFGATRLHEVLLVAMMMELYGWNEARALRDGGLLLLLTSVLAMTANNLATRATARIGERAVLMITLLCALTAALLGLPLEEAIDRSVPHLATKPIVLAHQSPSTPPPLRQLMPWPMIMSPPSSSNSTALLSARCPVSQSWCHTSARLPFSQLTACVLLTGASSTVLFTSSGSLYSRLLPANGQGLHWGLMGAAANVGRSAYPVLFTALYSRLGPQLTYLTLVAAVSALLLVSALSFSQLTPVDSDSQALLGDNNNHDPSVLWYKTIYASSLVSIMEDLVKDFKTTRAPPTADSTDSMEMQPKRLAGRHYKSVNVAAILDGNDVISLPRRVKHHSSNI